MGSQEFHDLANVTQAMIRKGSRPSREPESTSRRPACSARRRGTWGSGRRTRARVDVRARAGGVGARHAGQLARCLDRERIVRGGAPW